MTVGQLEEILKGVADKNMRVMIPAEPMAGFTGALLPPCKSETGATDFGIDEDELNQDKMFLIAPHGFSSDRHPGEQLN